MMAILSGFFGGLATILTVIGLYGVLSYFVARRRNEIGIRVALGARQIQVIAMVMRDAGRSVILGIALGVGFSFIATRGASALLFGLKPNDLPTLIAAGGLMAAIAAAASFIPARRAAKLDPMVALRHE
jgi:ABC-type antimicrobial peptide transport system permease subunit